jgi:hypothetical protein
MGGPSPVKANVRPKFVDTGDPVGDQQRYYDQTQAYTPENHNSRLKSFGMTLLRGIADAAAASGNDLNAIIGGGIAGGIAGAVDPAQDEYYHNERIAKPKALEGLGTAIKTKKAITDIAESEADAAYKQQQAIELPLKREEAARKSRVQALQRQLQLLLGKGQGLNRDNPEAARLIAALEKEGLDTPDLGPDVARAVPIHDEMTGEDYWEMTLKDGTVKRTSTGGSHTSATKVNNDTRLKIAAVIMVGFPRYERGFYLFS